jgi:amino acid adenylation domain-containing protein
MRRWAANFVVLLTSVCRNPTCPVGELELLHPSEQRFIASCLGNDPPPFQSRFAQVQDRFEQHAKDRPDAVALRHGEWTMSYAKLDARSNAIAAHLQAHGVAAGDLVGLCLSRTRDLVAGLIAILKVGAAYVPLDPRYPRMRLEEIARAADLTYVTSTRGLVAAEGIREIDVAEAPATSAGEKKLVRRDADALSHVIFTSGSTGRPKGVIITHANVLALLDWVHDIYREDELAAVLASTSVSFDISVFEIWAPLDVGGTIVLVENATELCARSFDDLTLINTVPSALRFLVEEGAIPPSVRIVNVAGEPLDKQLVNDLFARHRALALYNLYGPTEDTTYSTWFRMNGPFATDPPIGTPIAHSYGRILDERGHSVPVGAIGELHLGGAGVSRGYLGRPDLTAERFLRRSADHGERSEYRTGDLVRLGNDGALRYVGRADTQVKLRGFRIEVGEIEHALRHTDGIADACALVKRYQSGDAIVAYLIPAAAARRMPVICRQRRRASCARVSPTTWCRQSSWCSTLCRSTPAARSTAAPCSSTTSPSLRPILR